MLNRIKNLFKKKDAPKRVLSLIHFYTFPTGEKIYTYNPEDWGKISSRYYRGVQENAKYLHSFNLTPTEWKNAIKDLKKLCLDSVKKKNNEEMIMDIHNSLSWFEQKMEGTKTALESELEFIFCMFYLLEDETEIGYSPIHNERKIKLLNDNLEMRDFFLSNLKEQCKDLVQPSREDILKYLILAEKTSKLMNSETSNLTNKNS